MNRKGLNMPAVCVVIAAVLIGVMLLLPVGVSDDGSLFATAQSAGIYGDISSSYATMQFAKADSAVSAYDTMTLFLSAMKNLAGGIDTRALAAILAAILLCCIYFALRTARTRLWWLNLLAAALVLLVFIDQGYIGYLNSIHKESLIFVLTAGVFTSGYLLTREKQSLWPVLAFGLFGAGLLYVMPPYAFFGILMAVFMVRVAMLKKKRSVRLAAVVVLAALIATTFVSPRWEVSLEREMSLYNAVFYGVSITSDNFERDLEELGLSKELKMLSKTSYFDKSTTGISDEQLQRDFYQQMRYGKLVIFYLRHPVRLMRMMSTAVQNGTTIKLGYLGNYPQSSGRAEGQTSGFYTLYSTIKPRVIPNMLGVHLLFLLAFLAAMLAFRCRGERTPAKKLLYEFYVFLVLCAVLAIPVPVLFRGTANIAKHMFLYNVLFDLLFVSAIVGGAQLLYRRRNRLKEKYGVTQ